MLFYVRSDYVTMYLAIFHFYAISHDIKCCIVSFFIVLCYPIIFYFVLFYNVLVFYTMVCMLCYNMQTLIVF